MAKFRLEAALLMAKERGKKIYKKELAAKMWPNSTETGQMVNMTGLCSGRRTKVDPEWVEIICKECGCSADFLFGLSDE